MGRVYTFWIILFHCARQAKSSTVKVFERKHIMWTQICWRGLGDITYRETIMDGEFILRVMFVSHHPNAGWVQKGTPYQNVLQQKMKIRVPIGQYLVVPPRWILFWNLLYLFNTTLVSCQTVSLIWGEQQLLVNVLTFKWGSGMQRQTNDKLKDNQATAVE